MTSPAIAPPDRVGDFCEIEEEAGDVAGATTDVLVLMVLEADVDDVIATDGALFDDDDDDDDGAAFAAVE